MDTNLLDEVKRITKGLIFYYIFLAVIISFVFIFIKDIETLKRVLLGLLFGCIISALNFRLLAISIQKSVDMPPSKAQVYSGLQYSIRMFIIFVVLLVSANQPHLSIIGVALGLLGTKFIILFDKFVIQKFFRKEAK